MRIKFLLIILSACFIFQTALSQKPNVKFGNISEKDFATKVYSVDSNANAVIIADIGSSEIQGNTKGWFSLEFKQYRRVHILNKNGYDEANVSIPLYTSGNNSAEEQLDKVKAVTYNLENGKVVETKLDVKANVFKDKLSKNWFIKKFTLPNVKEGSIIEYEYTVTSDFLRNLRAWEFQGDYPRLWSEYNLSLPQFMGYVFITQGYKGFDINEKKDRNEDFRVIDNSGAGASETYRLTSAVTDYRWVIKNVPALKEESYTSTIDNHIAKIEFQLSEYRQPLVYRDIMGSWTKLADDLIKDEDFGQQLNKDNGWMNDITDPMLKGVSNKLEKAKKIFDYVRDNYTCTNHSDLFMGQSMRNLVKARNGTVSEVNLLLTALLKHEGINADPVILGTRSHGYTMALYPLLDKFNYVICRMNLGDKDYYLDASEPRLGFGYLPLRCYNGHARVINSIAEPIELNTDSVKERKFTSVIIINDDKGNLAGRMQQWPGYYESFNLRNRIKEKGQEQLMKDISKAFGSEIEIKDPHIDSLDKFDYPLGVAYEFDLKNEKEDIIYLNPMFGEGYKENPFKSAERSYPIEMPFIIDETYNLQIETPAGYVIDELPKQIMVKLNDQGDGLFEYRLSESQGIISLRSSIKFKRSYFTPDEYESLREFFNLIVKKHSEQIVFKKKK